MKYPILALLAVLPLSASAADLFVEAGVGVFSSGVNTLAETKMLEVGFQEDVWGPLVNRYGIGGWIDCAGRGRGDSAFIADQLGFQVSTPSGLFSSVFTGPTLISQTDTYLGGHFQLQEDVHFGLMDREGNAMSVFYKHLSSAGIETPNIGRDFIGVEIKF